MRLRPQLVEKFPCQDWSFQSRLKIFIEIENFKPGLKFSSVWIENVTRSIGIDFFESQGPLGLGNILFPLKVGLRWVFVNGLKWVQNPKGPKIEKIKSRLKCSISLENFNLDWTFQSPLEIFPTKYGGSVGGPLEIFNLAWKFQSWRAILNFFNLSALREVGQKWAFGCKSGPKCVKTHLCTHFKPISGYSRRPTFTRFKGGRIVFQKGSWGSPDPASDLLVWMTRSCVLVSLKDVHRQRDPEAWVKRHFNRCIQAQQVLVWARRWPTVVSKTTTDRHASWRHIAIPTGK